MIPEAKMIQNSFYKKYFAQISQIEILMLTFPRVMYERIPKKKTGDFYNFDHYCMSQSP